MINRLENTTDVRSLAYGSQQPQQINYVTDEETEVKSAKEIYYQWLMRLVMLFTILSLMFFASASLVLFKLAPQVKVDPFLIIKQDDSKSMVRYEPFKRDMASSRKIMENFIRQYIILRFTILNDEREMQSRWFSGGMVHYLSSQEVFNEFLKTEVNPKLNKYLSSHIVREVKIISVGKVGGEKSRIWKVDFKTYDLKPENEGLVPSVRYWTASVTASFIPERMFQARRLINPLGFTVIRYSQEMINL